MNILGVDPGLTTGICVLRVATDYNGFGVVWADEITWIDRFAYLYALINGTVYDEMPVLEPPQTIVMEKFRLRQGRACEQSGSTMPSSQVIGIVEALWWLRELELGASLPPIVFQEPSDIARTTVLMSHIPFLQGSQHKQDAYRHARYYFVTQLRTIKTAVSGEVG